MDLKKDEFPTVAEVAKANNSKELGRIVEELEDALDDLASLGIVLEDIFNDTEDYLSNSVIKNRLIKRESMACDYHNKTSNTINEALEMVRTIRSQQPTTEIF